ncbi:uncharacterized protein LOC144877994 [Branchiostoma floridae x Branchiostoma japonicum]
MFFVIVHLCFLTPWLGVTAAPTRSPREVTYTCPPGRVWDPINEDCPLCSICYENPAMGMCQNNACPGPTPPGPTGSQTVPHTVTVQGMPRGIVAVIVLGSILASAGILLAIIYLLYKTFIQGNAPERAENDAEEELKLPVQEDQRGSSERVVTE